MFGCNCSTLNLDVWVVLEAHRAILLHAQCISEPAPPCSPPWVQCPTDPECSDNGCHSVSSPTSSVSSVSSHPQPCQPVPCLSGGHWADLINTSCQPGKTSGWPAGSSTFHTALIWDINGQKRSDTDRHGQTRTEMDRSGQKRTETDRYRQKRTETDRTGQKGTELDRGAGTEEDIQKQMWWHSNTQHSTVIATYRLNRPSLG